MRTPHDDRAPNYPKFRTGLSPFAVRSWHPDGAALLGTPLLRPRQITTPEPGDQAYTGAKSR
jgi:hypothetical protein